MRVVTISFEEMLPIWTNNLWIGRKTQIKPTNGLKFLGGYDKSIENNTPTFFGAFINDECVAVNSGHATNDYEYRSRGVYVMPEYRRQGISQELFKATEDQCLKENKKILWSMPRVSSLQAYEKFGFNVVSDFFDDMEFGPNCFVVKVLEV